jgi:hypothetical protein
MGSEPFWNPRAEIWEVPFKQKDSFPQLKQLLEEPKALFTLPQSTQKKAPSQAMASIPSFPS